MINFLQIHWDPSPILVEIGPLQIRYYSLMFLIAFIVGLRIFKKIYIKEGIDIKKLDPILIYSVIGILFGARIGHFLFYDPKFLFENPLEVILPVQFSPEFKFVGFRGLASHGALIGMVIAMYFYSKKVIQKPILFILDRLTIPVALGAGLVRIGNLMNSEIIGKQTESNFGFVFKRLGENFPRHPAQLYEAIGYFLVALILWRIYWKSTKKNQSGYLLGFFLILLFSIRFIVEYFKEAQVDGREDWFLTLNTGQVLSIPLILVGCFLIFRKR